MVDMSAVTNGLDDAFGAVVIGRNEGRRLKSCLKSAADATVIVYVDSNSTDDSVSLAQECGADVVQLDMSLPFTAARARNAGFARLMELTERIPYVQFVDGDAELVRGWTNAAMQFLKEHLDVAVVCGQRIELHANASIFNKMCANEWNTPVGEAKSCGGESLVRVATFQESGGFRDEQIAHEEPELCSRIRAMGYKIWRIDQRMSLHDAAIIRVSQFYARGRRAGFGISQYLAHSQRNDPGTGREIIVRAFFWTFLPPLTTIIGLYHFGPSAVLALLIYPIQIARYAFRLSSTDYTPAEAVKVSLFSMLSKLAEAHGALEFFVRRTLKRKVKPILYR